MKRKLFSAILFGALLTASTSGLTSCKDYDDDISNLQSQIDKLATADQLSAKVSELQAAIASAQSAAEAKAAAAQSVADAAKSAAADAAAAASKAQSTADGASQAAKDAAAAAAAANEVGKAAQAAVDKLAAEAATKAELEAAAAAAKTYVDSVKDAIEAAHAADKATIEKAIADGLNEVKAEIAKTNEALAALDVRLKAVEDKLAAIEAGEGQEELIQAIAEELEAIDSDLEALGISVSEMITSIDLYYRSNLGFDSNYDLNFWKVKELANVFPEDKNIIAEDPFEFTADAVKLYEDSLLVRVNPVNAEICAEDVSLMNSQGTVIPEELVKVVDVHRFERNAPLTKAAGTENGLWVIKFKANDELDEKEFNEYAKSGNNPVAFAVAVDNCDENLSADRKVVTDYNVGIATGTPNHATTFKVTTSADSKNVSAIHNRYNASENGTAVAEKEYVWKNGVAAVTPDFTKNTGNAVEGDNRQANDVIVAETGEDITIEFPTNTKQPIKGFYVTLDWKRAVESGKTEINAWNSYSYVNVAKVKSDGTILEKAKLQEGNVGYIKVTDLASMTMLGDIIGFRVFAVNLDGTLVDPDGIAFYVGIGKNDSDEKVTLGTKDIVIEELTGTKKNTAYFPIEDQFDVDFDGTVNWTLDFSANVTIGSNTYTRDVPALGTDYTVALVNDKGETKPVAQATQVKVQIINPAKFIDNTTYNLEGELYKNVDNGAAKYLVRTVTLGVTKKLPVGLVPYNVAYNALQSEEFIVTRSANDYQHVSALDGDGNYLNPAITFAVDLKKFLVYDDANNTKLGTATGNWPLYGYAISSSVVDPNDAKKTIAATADNSNSYVVELGQTFADNSTVHSITASYKYAGISYAFRENGKKKANGVSTWSANGYAVDDYYATAAQTPTIKYMTWSHIDNADFMSYKFTLTQKVAPVAASGGTPAVKEQVVLRNAIEWSTENATIALGTNYNNTDKCFGIKDIIWKAGVKSQQAISQALATVNGDLSNLVTAGATAKYLYIADAWTMANGVKNAFFKPNVSGGELTGFTQVAPKSGEHAETLYIKVVDCFNAKTTIALPIQIVNSFATYVGSDGTPSADYPDW